MRAGGRLGELRFDTDLDVSHAVVRYLELLKLAALIARARRARAWPSRCATSTRASCRRSPPSSARSSPPRRWTTTCSTPSATRAGAPRRWSARDEPSLEPFLPRRGDGVVLSASDIDTYRTCPLKYKFARVFRIPQEPTLHQRFGILVHQVLERFHAPAAIRRRRGLPELLGLLEAGWRRGGFGDSEEERQLRGKAASALTRYHERFQSEEAQPVWFERQFTFKLGRHLLRGRVDRVDRLPGGEYELIDYKTGRPKTRRPARRRRPALAVRRRRARGVAAGGLAPGLLLPARRPEGGGARRRGRPGRVGARGGDRGRRGDPVPGVRADAVVRGLLDVRLPAGVPGGRALSTAPALLGDSLHKPPVLMIRRLEPGV